MKRLHTKIGASGRFSFGKPELLRSALGIEPGSVSPFAAINDRDRAVTIVLDQALMRHDTINFHPLINTRTTRIRREDFLRFLAATGHEPLIVAASARLVSGNCNPAINRPSIGHESRRGAG